MRLWQRLTLDAEGKQGIRLAERIEYWQEVLAPLGIGHWRIECVTICDETTSKCGALATTSIPPHYASARFQFTRDFLAEADELRLDEVIVHEWLHIVMRDTDEAVRTVKSWMPEATYEDWIDRMEHEHEGLVEQLARFIVTLHNASKA